MPSSEELPESVDSVDDTMEVAPMPPSSNEMLVSSRGNFFRRFLSTFFLVLVLDTCLLVVWPAT